MEGITILLVTFFGAIIDRFFGSKKTQNMIMGKYFTAIKYATISTIVYVGILKEDLLKAVIFALGQAIGMFLGLFGPVIIRDFKIYNRNTNYNFFKTLYMYSKNELKNSLKNIDTEKEFEPRTYEITTLTSEIAKEYADKMRESGLHVTTYPSWYHKNPTLEVKVRVTTPEEKKIAKAEIPDGALVTGEPIKFSAVWNTHNRD